MSVAFRRGRIVLELTDGRCVMTPLEFYPTLAGASARERNRWEFFGDGTALEWPDLDLQLSVDSIVAGRREHIPPPGWRDGLPERLRAFRESRGLP